jgi:DNA-binding CsgD family transcriptional regulator
VLANSLDDIALAPPNFRHRTIFAAAAGCGNVLAGGELWDEVAVETALVTAAINAGKPRREAERVVRDGLARGRTTPKRAPENTLAIKNWAKAQLRVLEWWQGVDARGSSLRILWAFGAVAFSAGKTRFELSYRQIAEIAGVSASTVAARRHEWGRYVRQVKRGDRFRGTRTTWQLVSREVTKSNSAVGNAHALHALYRFCPPPLSDPSCDLWFKWPNGWRIYNLLVTSEETIPPSEVADCLGLHRRTVKRNLERLQGLTMATRNDDGYWRAERPEMSDVWRIQDERKRRHAAEREVWRQWAREKAS